MKEKSGNIEMLGTKIGMTHYFDENNHSVPVTVIEVGPCPILQIKSTETDDYNAVQIGFEKQKKSRVSKALLGHFEKSKSEPVKQMCEFRTASVDSFKLGDLLKVTEFSAGENVDVVANTKGRGFQGVVKRFNFRGGKASHGSMTHRRGGSYGQCQTPGEVNRGKKMPGHMGNTQVTVQNLIVVKVIEDKNLLLVKGSVPGFNGSTVRVRKSIKSNKQSRS